MFVLCISQNVFAVDTYPQINVNGYKQYSFTSINVDEVRNLFAAQALLGGYYAEGPWQEKLKLGILGKLTDKLSVSYDLEQMPDTPEKFDVKVTYDKTELTFGDFQANFGGNEFVSTSKSLNGVMITSKDTWYDLTFVPSAKLKSETQSLVSQRGNNTKGPYNLGHGAIIEGSERIQLNNVVLTKGTDYSFDYYSGNITFSRILSTDDEIKYSYEFTNLLDLFFPTVSKRDFVGFQSSFVVDPTLLGVPMKKQERSVKKEVEYFPSILQVPEELISSETVALPPQVRIEPNAEGSPVYTITINSIPVITMHEISGETPALKKAQLVKKRLDSLIKEGVSTGEIRSSAINGEQVVNVRNTGIATATQSESAIYKVTQKELADKWRQDIISALLATPEVMLVEITPEGAVEQYEWESTGTYKLKNAPVIPYSESIAYQGTKLKRFEDYLINYQDGTISLLRPNLPSASEPLSIEYQYLEVAQESETLPGSGKGPYSLAHDNITDGSESIYVNNIPYIRDLDYSIDYPHGKIMFFTDIPKTANIIIKYKFLVITTPPLTGAPVVPRSLKVGVSYLKESGKRGATPPSISVSETRSGSDLTSNNNTLWLKNKPVTSTDEVDVRRNNALLVYGVDYVFPTVEASTGAVFPPTKLQFVCDPGDRSDGLSTGTIKFLTPVSASDEVDISYSYNKWSSDRYSGSGSTSQPTYFLGGFRNLVPGTELVQIWRKNLSNPITHTLTRNSSIDTFDGQYSIKYSNIPSLTFNGNKIVVDGETFQFDEINFTVILKFVAESSVSERPIEHDVTGFDSALTVGDYLSLQGSFARSKTDQVFTTVSTNETFHGNGSARIFALHSPGALIDGSEQIIMNTIKLNRDDQYAISYDPPGTITFFSITPSTADSISVDYSYQSTSGTVTSVTEKLGSAYQFGGSIKPLSNLELSADYKKADFDFAPMGGISIPLGSEFKHANTKYSPLPAMWSSWWLSGDMKESNVPLPNRTDKFLHSYDNNFATGFNTFGLAQVDFGFREFTSVDDLLPGTTVHNNDYKSNSYTLAFAPNSVGWGEFSLTNRDDARKTQTYTDTIDLLMPQDQTIDFFHTNNTIDMTRRLRLTVDYQTNVAQTVSYESGTRAPTRSRTTNKVSTNDLSYYLNSDLNFWNFRRLSAYFNRIDHSENDELPLKKLTSTLNETYHLDFVPIDQITTWLDHNRQETPTVTTSHGNPKTERTSASVALSPYSTTSLGWSGSVDDALQDNGAITNGNANTYSVNHVPIQGSNYKLTTKYTLSDSIRVAPLGTEKKVSTDTRDFTQDYIISYDPTAVWNITTGFNQEDYTNKNDSTSSPVSVESQSQTTSFGTLYKLTSDLDLSGDYSLKVTSTRIPSDITAQKALLDAHAIYKVLTYGTLNYDWSQEDNGGEVSGGSFVLYDYTRVMQSFSLNVVMPQNPQMILSSIVLKLAVKWAKHMDHVVPENSFEATLLTFEGTFNF